MEYLLEGFGWCNMPTHMVAAALSEGRLKRLQIAGLAPVELAIHVLHERGQALAQSRCEGAGLALKQIHPLVLINFGLGWAAVLAVQVWR